MNKLVTILRHVLRIMSRKGTPLSVDQLVSALDLGIELEVTPGEVREALQLLSHPPFDTITEENGLYKLVVSLEELGTKVDLLAQSLDVAAGLREAREARRTRARKPAIRRQLKPRFDTSVQLEVPASIIAEIRRIHDTALAKRCKQVTEVILKMQEGHGFAEACIQVGMEWNISRESISDACVRYLGLTSTSDFQQAVYDGSIAEILRLKCST